MKTQITVLLVLMLALAVFSPAAVSNPCDKNPDHKNCKPIADGEPEHIYYAESFGAVDGTFLSRPTKWSSVSNLVFNRTNGNFMQLSSFFLGADYKDGKDGNDCFPGDPVSDEDPGVVHGSMHLIDNDGWGQDDDLVMRIWFWAKNDPTDSEDLADIRYVLEFFGDEFWVGDFWPGDLWPEEEEDGSTRKATRWIMRTENKSYLKKEPCVSKSIGDVNVEITVWDAGVVP